MFYFTVKSFFHCPESGIQMESDTSTESNFHKRFLGYILYCKVYSGYILNFHI